MRKWIVRRKHQSWRITRFLEEQTRKGFSQKQWKRLLESNLVFLNGKVERFASVKLQLSDVVELASPVISSSSVLLYEDDYLSIWNKASGTLSYDVCPQYFLAHRLDKATSGAIILVKKPEYVQKMQDAFRYKQVKKTYIAIVNGKMHQKEGTITSHIRKKKEGFFVSGTKGSFAKTAYSVLCTGKKASLVKLFPLTGKTHQLRLHMQDIQHGILGDYRYGKTSSYQLQNLALHAKKVVFSHPFARRLVSIEADIPEDFIKNIKNIFSLS